MSNRSERLTVLTTEEAEYTRRDFKLCVVSFGPMSSTCGTAEDSNTPFARESCPCTSHPLPWQWCVSPVSCAAGDIKDTPEASAQVRTGALSRSSVSLRRRDYTSGCSSSPLPSNLKLLGNSGAAHACEPVGSTISSKLEPKGHKVQSGDLISHMVWQLGEGERTRRSVSTTREQRMRERRERETGWSKGPH